MLSTTFILRTSSSVRLELLTLSIKTNYVIVTATGDEQAPVHNVIGGAIVDACVRAGKEGRKFRVIIIIPAIPGFAGDLREDPATGTRAIMDYQYKSINRGEHSIKERIRSQGVDPDDHIFVFNLRSYDRLNTTPAMIAQEEKSGVKYQDVQRAEAEEIMGDGLVEESGSEPNLAKVKNVVDDSGDLKREQTVDQKRKFEEQREAAGLHKDIISVDSIAKNAMHGTKDVVDEPWDQSDPDQEKWNFIQEELYIHAKLCIVDDRTVICGSSNINDRSQLGFHDSELSIVMEDRTTIESTMDGKPYNAGRHAATLRRLLWREHLGLLPPEDLDGTNDANSQPPGDCPNESFEGPEYEFVADPLGDKVWEMWCNNASTNTEVFRDIFHADPDNSSKSFFLFFRLPRLPYQSTNILVLLQSAHSKTMTNSRRT
jgi:phospholipase D1/2